MSLDISDEIWVMKDGTEIQVRDMTEDHAKNVLRMLINLGVVDAIEYEMEKDWEEAFWTIVQT